MSALSVVSNFQNGIGWCLESFVVISPTVEELSCEQTDIQTNKHTQTDTTETATLAAHTVNTDSLAKVVVKSDIISAAHASRCRCKLTVHFDEE